MMDKAVLNIFEFILIHVKALQLTHMQTIPPTIVSKGSVARGFTLLAVKCMQPQNLTFF